MVVLHSRHCIFNLSKPRPFKISVSKLNLLNLLKNKPHKALLYLRVCAICPRPALSLTKTDSCKTKERNKSARNKSGHSFRNKLSGKN